MVLPERRFKFGKSGSNGQILQLRIWNFARNQYHPLFTEKGRRYLYGYKKNKRHLEDTFCVYNHCDSAFADSAFSLT